MIGAVPVGNKASAALTFGATFDVCLPSSFHALKSLVLHVVGSSATVSLPLVSS